MPTVDAGVTANYRKVKTGSQLGTPQLQALLIKTYNVNWGNLVTDTNTGSEDIKISGPDTDFSKIIRGIQDYAEIYFIGNPQTSAGGENNVTESVVWVNVNTNTSGGELRSGGPDNGRWAELEDHIVDILGDGEVRVYFAVPDGWIWKANDMVATQGGDRGHGWFPVVMTS